MQLCGCAASYPKISRRRAFPRAREREGKQGHTVCIHANTPLLLFTYIWMCRNRVKADASERANVNDDGSLGRPATFSDPVPFCSIRRFNRQARSKDREVMGRGEEAS